jgi:hypothetical protein
MITISIAYIHTDVLGFVGERRRKRSSSSGQLFW